MGEFKDCEFSAAAVRLDHPALRALVHGKDLAQMTQAIFLETPEQRKEREETIKRWESVGPSRCKIVFPSLSE